MGAPRKSHRQRKTARDRLDRHRDVSSGALHSAASVPTPDVRERWSRADIIGVISIVVTVLFGVIAFVTPELRRKGGLDRDSKKDPPAQVTPSDASDAPQKITPEDSNSESAPHTKRGTSKHIYPKHRPPSSRRSSG